MNIITPNQVIKNLKNKMDQLRAEGIEPTIENLNKQFLTEFKKKLNEENNG